MARIGWPRRADRAQLVDLPGPPPPAPDPSAVLLRIAAEALILQDEAEAVLLAVSRHGHLGVVAPRGGPLVSRFFALADQLPPRCADARLQRVSATLGTLCRHHALQVATALEFLASDGRSPLLHDQVSRYGGLGAPAALLEDLYRELRELR